MNSIFSKRSQIGAGLAVLILLGSTSVAWAQAPPPLGVTEQFAVLGASAVTGSAGGGTVVNGDVGSSPTATITNFPPSLVSPPFILHTTNDNVVSQAHADAVTASVDIAGRGLGTVLNDNLATVGALNPGMYELGAGDLPANTTLTLNGNGVFIFRVASSLTMNVGSSVTGTASPCNIFWKVGSAATLNGVTMRGTVIAGTSITIGSGNLVGRALALTGAVTMSNAGNIVGGCASAAAVPTPGSTGASCPNPASIPPAVTTMNPQSIPLNGEITVFFTVSGSQIPNALQVTASSSEPAIVPISGLTITPPIESGVMSVRIVPAAGKSGLTTISVNVRDPNTQCTTVVSFVLSVGVATVPTLAQWAVIALASLLMFAGYRSLQRRPVMIDNGR